MRRLNLIIKRLCDVVVSALGMILVSPLFIIIAVLIKVTSEGPVLFKQERIGKDGKIFSIYKFRTMIVNAEQQGSGVFAKNKTDNRITKVGRFLRLTSLDGRVIIRQTTESLENKGFREVSPLLFHRGFRPDSYNAVQSVMRPGWCQSA